MMAKVELGGEQGKTKDKTRSYSFYFVYNVTKEVYYAINVDDDVRV